MKLTPSVIFNQVFGVVGGPHSAIPMEKYESTMYIYFIDVALVRQRMPFAKVLPYYLSTRVRRHLDGGGVKTCRDRMHTKPRKRKGGLCVAGVAFPIEPIHEWI